MSRPYTEEEARKMFLNVLHEYANYWAKQPNKTSQEMCDGLVFSILNIFDGNTVGFPSLDLSFATPEEDKNYYIECGENWYPNGMVINNCQLHEMYYI